MEPHETAHLDQASAVCEALVVNQHRGEPATVADILDACSPFMLRTVITVLLAAAETEVEDPGTPPSPPL